MAYATLEDMKKLIPLESLMQLSDDEGLGAVNQSRVDEAIASADAEIDAYLGGRYAVPLAGPVPDVIRKVSIDMAVYNLYSRRVEEMPPVRLERYKSAVRMLESIAKGIVSLGVDAAVASPVNDTGGAETNKETDTNVFSRESLGGM